MDPKKSLDESKIIIALIRDVSDVNGLVFNTRSLRLTLSKVHQRLTNEGLSFLTKTLPKLGKAFDKALTGGPELTCTSVGQKPFGNTKLPRFLGELFSKVLDAEGKVLSNPDINCIKGIRDILYCFYKYELPYTDEQEQLVLGKFERTEQELTTVEETLSHIEQSLFDSNRLRRNHRLQADGGGDGEIPFSLPAEAIARTARSLLYRLLRRFDPQHIHPRHGPGAVATKQQLWGKYLWTNVSGRITSVYPFDAYFMASMGHVCDRYADIRSVTDMDLPAKVILVPKDSRGPRLISCEPVDFQWVQQGLGRALVELVESHYLTKGQVNFTHQAPNRIAALWGSETGKYATLDLNEASDRVSLRLVRLLFPDSLLRHLESCRSLSTVLPDGRELKLKKFAPMGSALCFPVLALTTWALLTAGAPDAYTRERILVYGDDVVVPTAYASEATRILELFGLKVNRDKSCTSGFFRESCGMDAFKGICVTPVRLRTVWSSLPAPDVYVSYIAYANSYFDKRYYRTYEQIVGGLNAIYGAIPDNDQLPAGPSLRFVPLAFKDQLRKRWNRHLQRVEHKVRVEVSPSVSFEMDGWSMLLRHFAESTTDCPLSPLDNNAADITAPREWDLRISCPESQPFRVRRYTERRASYLAWRWR